MTCPAGADLEGAELHQDANTGLGEDANADNAAADDFAQDKIAGLLGKRDWAVIAAENPRAEQASAEADATAMSKLEADLEAVGATYHEVRGKYRNEANSLAVVRISEEDPVALGKKYGQDSILNRIGLRRPPATAGQTIVSAIGHSAVPLFEGTLVLSIRPLETAGGRAVPRLPSGKDVRR